MPKAFFRISRWRTTRSSSWWRRRISSAISRGDAEASRHCAREHLRGTAGRLGIKLALDLDGAPLTAGKPRKR